MPTKLRKADLMRPKSRKSDGFTLPLFPPESNWRPPVDMPRYKDAKVLGVDIESWDPGLSEYGPGFITRDSTLVGVAVCPEDAEPIYVPLHHPEGNVPYDPWFKWLKDILESDSVKVGANILYDVEGLWKHGINLGGRWKDIQVTQALLDEEMEGGYSLDNIAFHILGDKKDESLLNEALVNYGLVMDKGKPDKGYIAKLPARYVGPYAEHDSKLPIQIYKKQLTLIHEKGLNKVLELEEKILKICWLMRLNGVRIDLDRVYDVKTELVNKETELLFNIHSLGGKFIDVWSGQQIANWCDLHKIKYKRTDKGNPSIDDEFFKTVEDPMLQLMGKYRRINKARRDFIDAGILNTVHNSHIHSQWHQLRRDAAGTRSGRFASSHPNHQQWPARDPYLGPLIRSCFIPEERQLWYKGDYSSQEPRLTIHLAAECEAQGMRACSGALKMAKAFEDNPRLDLHQWTAELCGIERRPAKSINLGIVYGMGVAKLARELGIDEGKARELLDRHTAKMPFMRGLARIATNLTEKRGYIKTILGRRRTFKDPQLAYKSLNAHVQGSAADMTKMAMVKVYEELDKVPLMTVHDELDYSVWPGHHHAITRQMETALELRVPIVVDEFIANNWGECK